MVIGICDDETLVLKSLRKLVKETMNRLKIDGEIICFYEGKELLDVVKKIDVLFLDIEMPVLDGIEIGKKIREQGSECKIIMATNQIDRFKEAFYIKAFRFITKPFQIREIEEALDAASKMQIGIQEIELFKDRNSYVFCQRDIFYMIPVNSAVEFVLKEGVFRKETSLTEMEKEMDNKLFYRINKHCIVNMSKIESYNNGILVVNGEEMKVSMRKKKDFEKVYTIFDVNYR